MFLIPLRPCKCSSFHNLSCQMHGIQLSREFEAPSTSIHRVDSFATHVACVAGGISSRLQPSLRVVVPRGRHESTPGTRIPPATQTTTYAYSCEHLPIRILYCFQALNQLMKIPPGICSSYTCMLQMNPPVIKRLVVVICFYIRLTSTSGGRLE